jgi:hypothetical protein
MSVFTAVYEATVIGTFLVLIVYTIETTKIRKINAQQKDLQLLPAIMIYIKHHSGSDRPFIKNIGFGTALVVNVLDVNFTTERKQFKFTFHLVDGNNTLEPQEERMLGVNLDVDNQSRRNPLDNFLAYFNPENLQDVANFQEGGVINNELPTNRNLEVHFKDITGQLYKTTINFSKDGISVAQAPKRIN